MKKCLSMILAVLLLCGGILSGSLAEGEFEYTAKGKNAEITVKLDEKGELESIAGSGAVKLTSVKGEEHLLEGKFNMDVSERGTTKAEVFDAEKYAAKKAQ